MGAHAWKTWSPTHFLIANQVEKELRKHISEVEVKDAILDGDSNKKKDTIYLNVPGIIIIPGNNADVASLKDALGDWKEIERKQDGGGEKLRVMDEDEKEARRAEVMEDLKLVAYGSGGLAAITAAIVAVRRWWKNTL